MLTGVRQTAEQIRQLECQLDDELRFHLEMQIEENIRTGMNPEQARTEALRSLGGLEQIKEQCREQAGIAWLQAIWQDVRFGGRVLLANPSFTAIVVLTLALGIGANAAMFSVVNAVLLQPLNFLNSDRLVVLRSSNREYNSSDEGISGREFLQWKAANQSFEQMAAYYWTHADLVDGDRTHRMQGLNVTDEFFTVLGLQPALGRAFKAEEHRRFDSVMILGGGRWRRQFSSDTNIVGTMLPLHSWRFYPRRGPFPFLVTGVITSNFRFLPMSAGIDGSKVGVNDAVDFWMPLRIDEDHHWTWRTLHVVARLRPGVTLEQARSEVRLLAERQAQEYPESNAGWEVHVIPLHEYVVGESRPALLLLFGAVGFVLLIGCVNVTNLLLARNVARQKEIAVRAALGASRMRLTRQLLTETMLLVALGCGVGFLFAVWGLDGLIGLAPRHIPRLAAVSIDLRVLIFTTSVAVLAGLLVGLLPAMLATRTDLNQTLKEQDRSVTTGSVNRRFLNLLVVAEVSLALLLLVTAGLMIRSFARIKGIDPGFNVHNLLSMTVSLPEAKYEWKHNSVFCNRVLQRVEAMPGVVAAGAIRGAPLNDTRIDSTIIVEGKPATNRVELPMGQIRVVHPGYFKAMGIPLLEGRLFEPQDCVGEIGYTKVAVINKTMARRFWHGETAVGKRFKTRDDLPWMEVCGVVGDVKYARLEEAAIPDMYYPEALFPQATVTLLVRTSTDPRHLTHALQDAVDAIQPDAVISDVRTMQQAVSHSMAERRFSTLLLAGLAAVALLLAIVGIFGVISYSVSQRTHELGIRMALGAQSRDIFALVMGKGLKLSLAGTAIGLAAAAGVTQVLRSQLYGVSALDPITLAAATILLNLVAVLACYIPARRAVRTNPVEALHCS